MWGYRGALGTLLVVVLLVGCGSGEPPEKKTDELSYELFPSTHLLDKDVLAALTAYDADGSLHFSGTPSAVADIQPREVVIGNVSKASPTGFLRMVTAVDHDANGLVLRTAQAPIQMAFRKLHVKIGRRVADLGDPALGGSWATRHVLSSGSKYLSKDIDFYPVDGDGDHATPNDQVHVTGKLGGGFDYVFGLDVDWGDVYAVPGKIADCIEKKITGGDCTVEELLPEAKVGFAVSASADGSLGMQGVDFLPYEADYDLGEVQLPKITYFPLVFLPAVKVTASVSGAASSQFSLGLGSHASAGVGVSFSSKHGASVQPPDASFTASAPEVDATLAANGRIAIGPELHLRLYGIAGPWAGIKAYAELSADQQKDPCYELHAGVSADFGFDIVTPDLPLIHQVTLADWEKGYDLDDQLIDSGACKPLPGGGDASPTGGDPDAASFSHPTFTPWSRSYADSVDVHPYQGPGGQLEWIDATPGIDGRFVVSGSDTRALLKLDPDGTLVWARRYTTPNAYDPKLKDELLPGRVLNLGNGTMLVAAYPYTLLDLEASGAIARARHVDLPHRDTLMRWTSTAAATDGGYFVGGTIGDDETYPLQVDAWLMRFDPHGQLVWSKRWGTAADGETLRSLVAVGDGVVASGATWVPTASRWHAFTVRFDADGAVAWSKQYDARQCGSTTEASSYVQSGLLDRDGQLIFAGSIEDPRYAALVFKLAAQDGSLSFSAADTASDLTHPGPAVSHIVALPTSGYLVSGTVRYSETGQYSGPQDDLFVGATDSVGRLQWLRRFGGHRVEGGVPMLSDTYGSVTLTHDGGAFVVGFTDSLAPNGNGVWAMKLAAKDGLINFDPKTTAVTGDVPYAASGDCFTQSDWSISPVDQQVELLAQEVSVESLTLQTLQQTP